MYPVSDAYKEAMHSRVQRFRIKGTVGTVPFTDANILSGSLSISNQCSDNDNIGIGQVYIGELNCTFMNLNIARYDWYGKEISLFFGQALPPEDEDEDEEEGQGKGDGGKLGGIERKRLRSEFSEAVGEKPEVGRIYGPFDTPDGVFWLKVLAYRPAEHIPFERSSVEIRRRLEAQLRRESREKYCARLRKGAIVRYFILAAPAASGGDNKEAEKNSTIQP